MKAAENVHAIVHLAALTTHEEIVGNRYEALDINLRGTRNLLEVIRESKTAKKLIYSSSGKVYGRILRLPITEEHPLNPKNILGKSKRVVEDLIDFYVEEGKEYILLRIFNVYGPGQRGYFLVPTVLSQLRGTGAGQEEITLGDIRAVRDYTYIDDVVDAFVKAVEKTHEDGLKVYNIASNVGSSAQEIVGIIGELTSTKIVINVDEGRYRADEEDIEYASFDKARESLGWKPRHELREGLKKTIQEST
jgi:UDP-glucose 4-epimerase